MMGPYGRALVALDRAENRIVQANEALGHAVIPEWSEMCHGPVDLLGDALRSVQFARQHLKAGIREDGRAAEIGE